MHYKGLFPHGQDGVMAIGAASVDGGQRLSLAAVTQLGGLLGFLGDTQNEFAVECDGVLGAAFIGSVVGPCDATCAMKTPSSAICLQAMQNPTCLAVMLEERDRASGRPGPLQEPSATPTTSDGRQFVFWQVPKRQLSQTNSSEIDVEANI